MGIRSEYQVLKEFFQSFAHLIASASCRTGILLSYYSVLRIDYSVHLCLSRHATCFPVASCRWWADSGCARVPEQVFGRSSFASANPWSQCRFSFRISAQLDALYLFVLGDAGATMVDES